MTLEELKISLEGTDRSADESHTEQCTPADGAPTTPDVPEPAESTEASDAQDRERVQRDEEVRYENHEA